MSTIAFRGKMGDTWYDIAFRYDADIVDLIKTTIPSAYRKYDPGTKVWSAGNAWAQAFANAAKAAGHDCVGITTTNPGPSPTGGTTGFWQTAPPPPYYSQPPPGPQGPSAGPGASAYQTHGKSQPPPWQQRAKPPPPPMPPPPPQPAITENWARELMRRCPPELREKLYKSIARVLHTDLGGDQRLMQELNDARNAS